MSAYRLLPVHVFQAFVDIGRYSIQFVRGTASRHNAVLLLQGQLCRDKYRHTVVAQDRQ